MSPPHNTAAPSSTGSFQAGPSPGRQALTAALLACLKQSVSVGSFLDCLKQHAADVDDWIAIDLKQHFHDHWKNHQQLPNRRQYVDSLLKDYRRSAVTTYCTACREIEHDCKHRKRYQFQEVLGQGGFGEVVKAFDSEIERLVAIKYSHDVATNLQEVRTAAKLTGPGFVPILDVIHTKTQRLGVVMELVAAPTLGQALKDHPGPWELRRVCRIMESLLEALGKVHALGIAHNDLKPANLFLAPDDTVLVSDFGGATLLGEKHGQHTPGYKAPEVWRGQPNTVKTDLYSAACIAHELLTGRRCHPNAERDRYTDVVLQWNGTPDDLSKAVATALLLDPIQRPASAADFARPFRDCLDRLPKQPSADDHRLGPTPPHGCHGRDDFIASEVAAIARGLGSPGRARLYFGPGGIGKSTVAQAIARHPKLAELFGKERYHIALDGVVSAEGVAGSWRMPSASRATTGSSNSTNACKRRSTASSCSTPWTTPSPRPRPT